jgi:hypothetical protein
MKTGNYPTGVEEPKLQLNRPLVQIDEYADKLGVTRGLIEQAAELGVIHTRKFRGETFVLDVPIPQLDEIKVSEQENPEDLEQVVSKLLQQVEEKERSTQKTDNKAKSGIKKQEKEKDRNEEFKRFLEGVNSFVKKINFRVDLKEIFRRKPDSQPSKPETVESAVEFPGYPEKAKLGNLQRLRVRDLLANFSVLKTLKTATVYALVVAFTFALLANLWIYTYSSGGSAQPAGNLNTAAVDVSQLKSEYSQANQQLNQLKEQLAESETQNEQLKAQIDSLQDHINTLTAELSTTRSNLKQLRYQNKEALQRLESN